MRVIATGISDYKEIIEKNYCYVDKTLLIEELLSTGDKVTLLCRPRRFGKTLNLSMLHYFFEKTPHSHAYLFTDKLIWRNERMRAQQGNYPVIFLTFKDVKEQDFQGAYKSIVNLIIDEFKRHEITLSRILDPDEHVKYRKIIEGSADRIDYSASLLFLSRLLNKAYAHNVMVLIDEYDAPIHAAYTHGYYQEMVDFIRILLSKVLKDNSYLERGVLTGILRTAKEGIFSGLNNLTVCTLLNDEYADKFGFTESEVSALVHEQNIPVPTQEITSWYNGYHAGRSTLIYNPWSILMCAKNHGALKPYWANTSGNEVVKDLITKASSTIKNELLALLQHELVEKPLEEAFTFSDINWRTDTVWSLLFFSGYITYSSRTLTSRGKLVCSLRLPNREIEELYKNFIEDIFAQSFTHSHHINEFFTALMHGDCALVQQLLQEFVLNATSFHDIDSAEPERSYHLFVLGMLVTLEGTYHVRSNRESGYGRYDIMLIPRDTNKPGVIIEFKRAMQQTLEQAADAALEQIHEKQYAQELRAMGIETICSYGIAFQGREVLVKGQCVATGAN